MILAIAVIAFYTLLLIAVLSLCRSAALGDRCARALDWPEREPRA